MYCDLRWKGRREMAMMIVCLSLALLSAVAGNEERLPTTCPSSRWMTFKNLANKLQPYFFPPKLEWYTMVHADGSILQTWIFLRQHGLQWFISIWPEPTAIAWKIINCYAAFEAALQLWLPGRRVEGPISPAGNGPVYKDMELYVALARTLISKFSRTVGLV